jgi:hydroxypyruvate reductase
MKSEILLTAPIYAPLFAQLEREYTVHRLWQAPSPERLLEEIAHNVRAVVTTGLIGFRAEQMEALPKLGLVACFGNPRGTIDLAAAAKRGIAVTNTPDRTP